MGLPELDRVKQAIVAPRSAARKTILLLVGMALATAGRYAVDRGASGIPFLTYTPVVLLAAVFLGAEYAVIAAVLSLLAVRLIFVPTGFLDSAAPMRSVIIITLFAATVGVIVLTGHLLRRVILESEAHRKQQDAFNSELHHRTKNSLQIFRALIARGPRGEDPQTYFASLDGRLDALARSNALLRFGVLEAAPMRELVTSAIAPFDRACFNLAGPDCLVDRSAATPLVMALHELCTNAIKYGALSADGGTVSIEWHEIKHGSQPTVSLTWRESGGPIVAPPVHRGLGTRMLVANGGLVQVTLDWHPTGLICEMHVKGHAQ